MRKINETVLAGLLGVTAALAMPHTARATAINDLFVFGDSYSDTGAYVPLTNGSTAVGYLAQNLGINLVTSRVATPGTSGVNFAQSGARIAIGPTPPATQPLSLTQQVAQFQNYVTTGAVTFNPSSSLFFLLGGLNDHPTRATGATPAEITAATIQQVTTLYNLGARLFDIALIPSLVPAFADSAANINPVIRSLVPQLRAQFPTAYFGLSNWGPDYDAILTNPSAYGITNTTDQCFNLATGQQTCSTPDQYFYYYVAHPSAASHRIVGAELVAEVNAIPEPSTFALLGIALVSVAAAAYGSATRRGSLVTEAEPT